MLKRADRSTYRNRIRLLDANLVQETHAESMSILDWFDGDKLVARAVYRGADPAIKAVLAKQGQDYRPQITPEYWVEEN